MHHATKRSRGRRATKASLVALASVALLAVGASSASALSSVTCAVGTQVSRYDPPLTNVTQRHTVTTTTNLSLCAPVNSTIQSGTSTSVISRTTSCTSLLGGGSDDKLFRWSNGQTSDLRLTASVQRVTGEVIVTNIGYVASGALRGGTALGVLTLLGADGLLGACDRQGVAQLQGTYTLQLVDLIDD